MGKLILTHMSWLSDIEPCTEVYVFQADLRCEDCARKIMADLEAAASPNTGNSGNHPQGPYADGGGEDDDPHFCGSGKNCANAAHVGNHTIGCPLGNPLTHDGAEELIKSVLNLMLGSRDYERRLSRLYLKVWSGDMDHHRFEWLRRIPAKFEKSLPASLEHRIGKLHSTPDRTMFQDDHHVYLTSTHDGLVDLIRCPVSEEGTFPSCDVATVPRAVAAEVAPEQLIRDAIDEGAWD